jgi:outer membrane protein
MKKTLSILAASFALCVGASAAEQKIATIDLRKVFDNYHRTKQADASLKDQAAELKKESDAMIDQFRRMESNYTKLIDSANDQALAQAERDKRKKEAENALLGLREMEMRIKQYDQTSRTTLTEKSRRVRENLLNEIRDTVKARVKNTGHTLVIDTAAETVNGTPIVLFSTGVDDITDAVLAQLNVGAPASTTTTNTAKPDARK